jgi:PAS domain S-box-containing protein
MLFFESAMKIPRRFLLVPLILATFSYLFYASYKEVKDRTLEEFNTHQFILAKQASRGIESFFIYYQRELTFLSGLNFFSDIDGHVKPLLKNFYKSHADQIEAITLVDTNGILKYTYPFIEGAIGRDISNQEHVKKILKWHQPIVSDVFTSVQGFDAIALHVPIMQDSIFNGSIAILISLDKLSRRFIENIRTGETGYGCLISEDGTELYNPRTSQPGRSIREMYSRFPSVLELINRSTSEKAGTSICYISSAFNDNKVSTKTLAAFYRVPLINTFWTILIFSPEKEIFSNLTSFKNRLYILFFLILIVMVVYFYFTFKASVILKEEKIRKSVERTLRESEKRFRTMFELSPAGIILLDEKGIIIETNSSFCDMLGYTKKELIGQNIGILANKDNLIEIEKNIAFILSGKTLRHEVINYKKDGTLKHISLCESMIFLPDGKPGILSVANDVTEKKRSEEKMKILSRAIESIGECVTITDNNNRIFFVNNAFCKTYGYTPEEVIGHDISLFRVLDDKEETRKLLRETIHGGWVGQLMNKRKDGSEFPIELSTSPIKDEKGNLIALIGIAVDITERQKERQELIISKEKAEESDKLKSAFLANMSHEIRTPLNAIIGFSGLMVENTSDTDTSVHSKIIYDSGMHLLGLVEDILDISMIETGQVKINYEKTAIYSVLNEVEDIISGEKLKENKHGIDLILKTDPKHSEHHIFTDKRKLKQVLLNLLKNSLKFTDSGYIEFGYEEIEQNSSVFLKFFVKDTGIGIEQKYHHSIFEIFRQIDDSYSRNFGGTGIGLSIAKKTIDLFGGNIWVESEKGKGSSFFFTIPAFRNKSDAENLHLRNLDTPYTIF